MFLERTNPPRRNPPVRAGIPRPPRFRPPAAGKLGGIAIPSRARPHQVASAFALVLGLASGACGVPVAWTSAEPGPQGQVVEVEALNLRFSPRTVEAEPGVPLTVTVHNSSLSSHTFTTAEPVADVVVDPGKTKEVTFVPEGRTTFFCRFHQGEGMKGSLCLSGEPCDPRRGAT